MQGRCQTETVFTFFFSEENGPKFLKEKLQILFKKEMCYFTLESRELGPDYIHNLGCFKKSANEITKTKNNCLIEFSRLLLSIDLIQLWRSPNPYMTSHME